jgi:hypothetical protein
MANYTVIGGDGKQYGPITESDLRKWIAEGRLSAQSLAKAESDAEFRALSTFPELAGSFAAAPPLPGIAPLLPTGGDDRKAALDKVRVPAMGLMISAILSVIFIIIEMFGRGAMLRAFTNYIQQMGGDTASVQQMQNASAGPFAICTNLFQLIISVLIFVGATRMLKLRSYEFSFAAAIMSVVPCITSCCAWPLGLIFGIWAMAVLGKSKSYFS